MAFRNLRAFVRALAGRGELVIIDAPVSAELEITEITDRVCKAGGKALLFTRVNGSPYPLLINAMGSFERMSLALGAESLDEIGAEVAAYLDLASNFSIGGLFGNLPRLLRLFYACPLKSPFAAPCQTVMEATPDLFTLPVLKCWPQDAGRFLTLPLVFTRDPRTCRQNLGMYRMQVLDKNTTAMHWHPHKDGAGIFADYAARGERMPVSVALGCDPAITYAATAPLPRAMDELLLAGWLRRKNVRLVKCRTNALYVPAEAEFVLEGYVDPREPLVREGPFGDHTGYYSLADAYPRFHVVCITRQKHPIYPATIVGRPPMEDCYLAKATERIFLPVLRLQIPELVDLNLPPEGVFHNCALVSVRARYPGAARKVMNAIWGMGQMMYTKLLVAVDETVDVQNPAAVLAAVLRTLCRERLFFCEGALDALDHSSARALYGTRLGIDATGAGDGVCACFRVLNVKKERAYQGREALTDFFGKEFGVRFAVAVDGDIDTQDASLVLWKLFNNVDAARDLIFCGDQIGVDATRKRMDEGLSRGWPEDIAMSDEIKQLVTERWAEYGIAKMEE